EHGALRVTLRSDGAGVIIDTSHPVDSVALTRMSGGSEKVVVMKATDEMQQWRGSVNLAQEETVERFRLVVVANGGFYFREIGGR
ncbi:MAG: hypothetical protein HQL48_06680, partial [Gammaproteobacteria bacterium]|nr:hypothetical protein [Gammaproteobacteria bacterium]